jgi:uncharacterized Zn finger protein
MFALRGLSKEALQAALGKTSLGKALVAELSAPAPVPIAAVTLYPLITTEALPRSVSPREFWQGAERLGPDEPFAAPAVPALTIKREGDFPAFWPRENSFIEVMEEFYGRVRKKVE